MILFCPDERGATMTTEPDTSTWKKTPDGIAIPPPSPDDVLYKASDGVARITLNRPIVLNAINRNVTRLLDAALDQAEADDDVRAVILTGAGRAFSAAATCGPSALSRTTTPARGARSTCRCASGVCRR